MRNAPIVVALLLLGLASPVLGQAPAGVPAPAQHPEGGAEIKLDASPEGVFNEAWMVVRSAFYDPGMNGVDWDAVRTELLPRARAARSRAEVSGVINEALARLHASHTAHYQQDQREYYELLDVFWPDGVPERAGSAIRPGPVEYVGIGLATRTIEGKVFVADVYDGGPADEAGVLAGDELLGVEDGQWGDVVPFRERRDLPTRLKIQRSADAASCREIMVVPRVIRPREMFAESIRRSARVIERDGVRAAYIRVRSYASPMYHEIVQELVREKFVDEPVGLVIDIRGGWGGANPSYMDIFNPVAPTLEFMNREGKRMHTRAPTWRGPVAMLIDGGSRSGKEVLACAFKKHHVGTLVGERTAGAVLAGTPRPLADGSILYIAIQKVLVDGEVIEGVGVTPDVEAHRTLMYAAGADQQIDAAVRAVGKPASR